MKRGALTFKFDAKRLEDLSTFKPRSPNGVDHHTVVKENIMLDTCPKHHFLLRRISDALDNGEIQSDADLEVLTFGEYHAPERSITPIYKLGIGIRATDGEPFLLTKNDIGATGGVIAANKLKILITAGMHAREWQTQEMLLNMVNELAFSVPVTVPVPQAKPDDYTLVELWVVPLVNLTGYLATIYPLFRTTDRPFVMEITPRELVDGLSDRELRMTRKCCPGEWGCDLNRNFGFCWQPNVPGVTEGEINPGEAPFSEPETQWLRDLVMGSPSSPPPFDLVIDAHDYGDFVVCFPMAAKEVIDQLGYTKQVDAVSAQMNWISTEMSKLLFSKDDPYLPYNAHGIFSDWASSFAKTPALTIEVGTANEGFSSDSRAGELNKVLVMRKIFSFISTHQARIKNTKRVLHEMNLVF